MSQAINEVNIFLLAAGAIFWLVAMLMANARSHLTCNSNFISLEDIALIIFGNPPKKF